MPPQEANLLMGEANVLTAMSEQGSSKLGMLIAAGLGVAVGIWMIATVGTWLALEFRKNNDTAQINDPRYTPAKELISEEATWKKQLTDMEANLEMLPDTTLKSADVMTEFFAQVRDQVESVTTIVLDNSANSITTTINVKDFSSYIELRDSINENGYFIVSDVAQLTYVADENGVQHMQGPIVLSVTEDTLAKAAEAAEEAKANKTAEVKKDNTAAASTTDVPDATDESKAEPAASESSAA